MKYPTNMYEATQAAHDERSKAFFELLGWLGKSIRLLLNYIVAIVRGIKTSKLAPSPKDPCVP